MFIKAYTQAFKVLAKKPLRLLGLSLLSTLICAIATLVTLPVGIIGTAFSFVITAGMAKVYLDGLEGKQVYSDQLFEGTKKFFKVAGGMAWRKLWSVIWVIAGVAASIVVGVVFSMLFGWLPFGMGAALSIFITVVCLLASVVFMVYKSYSYEFVPYILMTQPEVNATEALRISMKMTSGKVLHMWLADLVCNAAVFFAGVILGALAGVTGRIPFIGGIFGIISFVFTIVCFVFLPIFKGLYKAAFFKLPKPVKKVPVQPQYQQPVQPQYQQPVQPQYQAPQQPAQPQYQAPAQPQAPVQPQNPVQQ